MTLIETLKPTEHEPYLSGMLSILTYLEGYTPSFIDKLFWTSFLMIEKTTTKSVIFDLFVIHENILFTGTYFKYQSN